MYENMSKQIDQIEAELDGVCPRCSCKKFERRGSHDKPYLRCGSCGLEIVAWSKHNRFVDLGVALGIGGFMIGALVTALIIGLGSLH